MKVCSAMIHAFRMPGCQKTALMRQCAAPQLFLSRVAASMQQPGSYMEDRAHLTVFSRCRW